jgi:SAM-dependent methyltransferase
LEHASPHAVIGVEPSDGFLNLAKQTLGDRARLLVGDATTLPLPAGTADVVVSGLVLNFVPDTRAALEEMGRVATPGATIAAYVWDYSDKMEVLRLFWDAAVALDAAAALLHEGARFPVCRPGALRAEFEAAGLADVEVVALDATAEFASFDDYWRPFLGGQGPAPSYLTSLSEQRRWELRDSLRARVARTDDQPIALAARCWAVRGTKRA